MKSFDHFDGNMVLEKAEHCFARHIATSQMYKESSK